MSKKSKKKVETPEVEQEGKPLVDVDFNETPATEDEQSVNPTEPAPTVDTPSATVDVTPNMETNSIPTNSTDQETDKPKKKRKKKVKEASEGTDPTTSTSGNSEKSTEQTTLGEKIINRLTEHVESKEGKDTNEQPDNLGFDETGAEVQDERKPQKGYRLGNLEKGTRFRILGTPIEASLTEAVAEGDCKVRLMGGQQSVLPADTEVELLKPKKKKPVDSEPEAAYNTAVSETNNESQEESVMKLNKSDCVRMLLACGVKTAKQSMKLIKCQSFVDGLGSTTLDEGYTWPEGTEEEQERYHKVVRLLQKGKEVEVVEDESPATTEETAHETNGHTPKKRGRKAAAETNGETHDPKTGKKKRKTNPDRKTSGETDRFGSRLGSVNAQINAALGKKPIGPRQLVEKAGVKLKVFEKTGVPQYGAVYTHLKKLAEAGFVEKTDDGYCLKK